MSGRALLRAAGDAAQGRATIAIRPETPADYASIAQVVEAAFGRPNEALLVELIRVSDCSDTI